MELGLHVGEIAHPFATCGAVVEGICIGIDDNALELAVDNACKHIFQLFVLIGKLNVGPYLGA